MMVIMMMMIMIMIIIVTIIISLTIYILNTTSTTDDDGYTPLHIILEHDDPSMKVVELMLLAYPDAISKTTRDGLLPIHCYIANPGKCSVYGVWCMVYCIVLYCIVSVVCLVYCIVLYYIVL